MPPKNKNKYIELLQTKSLKRYNLNSSIDHMNTKFENEQLYSIIASRFSVAMCRRWRQWLGGVKIHSYDTVNPAHPTNLIQHQIYKPPGETKKGNCSTYTTHELMINPFGRSTSPLDLPCVTSRPWRGGAPPPSPRTLNKLCHPREAFSFVYLTSSTCQSQPMGVGEFNSINTCASI